MGNHDISLWVWHRAAGIGFRSSGHPSRTVHPVADESRASRSIHLRIANRLEPSANLSSTLPADTPFTYNHSAPQEPPKCQKLSLPFPTPRAYNLAEMMSGVLDSRRNHHMQVVAKVKKVARPDITRPLHGSSVEGISQIAPTAEPLHMPAVASLEPAFWVGCSLTDGYVRGYKPSFSLYCLRDGNTSG